MELTMNDVDKVWFAGDHIYLRTKNGNEKGMPLRWFPRLQNATEAERNDYEMRIWGLHWKKLDEDLSYSGFFTFDKDKLHNNRTEAQMLLARFPAINISELAVLADISPTLMRHYACGVKTPSEKRFQQIKDALRQLGYQLIAV